MPASRNKTCFSLCELRNSNVSLRSFFYFLLFFFGDVWLLAFGFAIFLLQASLEALTRRYHIFFHYAHATLSCLCRNKAVAPVYVEKKKKPPKCSSVSVGAIPIHAETAPILKLYHFVLTATACNVCVQRMRSACYASLRRGGTALLGC